LEDIIDALERLGFKQNDAKVYIALLQLGRAKPVIISKKTNIVRARIYDSLNRLEKKGFIDREAVQRAPMYFAKSPEIVFDKIKNDLEEKLQISEKTIEKIKEKVKPIKEKETWAIKGRKKVKANIMDIIEKAENEILCLITPEHTKNVNSWIFDLILDKIKKALKISILLKIQEENVAAVKNLSELGVKVYHWSITEEIPLGIYTSDSKRTLITVIGSWTKFYRHDIGFLIQGRAQQHRGFEFLVNWYFSACIKGEDRFKELEGDADD